MIDLDIRFKDQGCWVLEEVEIKGIPSRPPAEASWQHCQSIKRVVGLREGRRVMTSAKKVQARRRRARPFLSCQPPVVIPHQFSTAAFAAFFLQPSRNEQVTISVLSLETLLDPTTHQTNLLVILTKVPSGNSAKWVSSISSRSSRRRLPMRSRRERSRRTLVAKLPL